MYTNHAKTISRLGLIMLILLSGLALLPFSPLSAEQLDWRAFAGIYEAELDVAEDSGAPGSAFLFHGAGYPANQPATILIDGIAAGSLMTNGDGQATFLIQTHPSDALGSYQITLAVDANSSATEDITLNDDPLLPPPPDFDGLVLPLSHSNTFLPIVRK